MAEYKLVKEILKLSESSWWADAKDEWELKYIYDHNPDVYSIQLADTSGTIINGWPPCNSSIGYSTSQNLNKPFDSALEQVMISKQENIIQAPIFEGGEGRIMFIPVLVHEDLYGVLIAIEPQGN